MKICICVSGQVRGDLDGLKKLQTSLIKNNIEHLFIFSVWKRKGKKSSGGLFFGQLCRIFETEVAHIFPRYFYGLNFWDNFGGQVNNDEIKDYLSSNEFDCFENKVIDIEDEILHLEFTEKKVDNNSIRMLYKRWRCNEIKKKIESEKGEFDIVIICRPDLNVSFNAKEVNIDIFDKEIFIPSAYARKESTNDFFAYGKSKTIDHYSKLFFKTEKEDWQGIHKELFYHLSESGVKEKKPKLFSTNGPKKNKLLSYKEIEKKNRTLDEIIEVYKSKNISEDLILKLINKHKNKDITVSIFNAASYSKERELNHIDSLCYFLLAEISNYKIKHFNDVKGKYLINRLKKLSFNCNLKINKHNLLSILIENKENLIHNKQNLINNLEIFAFEIENEKTNN